MSLAIRSLIALLAAIVLSCTTTINVGLISMVFAWILSGFVELRS